jgi:hypothetical protein
VQRSAGCSLLPARGRDAFLLGDRQGVEEGLHWGLAVASASLMRARPGAVHRNCAKLAPLAAEGDEFLGRARVAVHAQETILKPAALQNSNCRSTLARQRAAALGERADESWTMLFNQLYYYQGILEPVPLMRRPVGQLNCHSAQRSRPPPPSYSSNTHYDRFPLTALEVFPDLIFISTGNR